MEHQMVIFDLADEYYGVDIGAVESIVKMQEITAMPNAPEFVEGVTNLRGKVLPVIDLRKRFDLPESPHTKETRIVVIAIEDKYIGMVVDAVTEVISVPEEAIEPPSSIVTTADANFVTGIAKMDDRLIINLDLLKVLTPQEQALVLA